MWLKLDDGFATHPKILEAGILALGIQVRALCYASQNKTDGFIPANAVPLLLTGLERIGIETATIENYAAMGCGAAEIDWPAYLVDHRLWEVRPGGYCVHDYLDWNVSKKDYDKWIKKLASGGRKGMKSRWGKAQREITQVITQDITYPVTVPSTSTSTLNHLSSPESESGPKSMKHTKKKGNGAAPESLIPEDWAPTESHEKLARARGLDLPLEAAHFRGRAQELKWTTTNWALKFTNFMLQELKWQHQRRK